jgi:two-component sensor histidine kinase
MRRTRCSSGVGRRDNRSVGRKKDGEMTEAWLSLFRRLCARFAMGSARAWAASAALLVAAFAAKLALDALAGEPLPPYIIFYPAVVLTALIGGPRVGLAAAAASLIIAWYVFLPVPYSFTVADRATALSLEIFAVTGALLAFAAGFARVAYDAAFASEARRAHSARESVHRIKNLIAVVQAISAKVGREAVSYDDYVAIFSQRLAALALAQDVLVRSDWQDVEVKQLVESALAPFLPNPGLRVEFGPPAQVPARYVGGLCMALYELCTNAMKYGALADGRGPVTMAWRLDGDACVLEWDERTATREHGENFGTQLIRSALGRDPATEVSYEVGGDRVVAVFRWPCRNAAAAPAEAAVRRVSPAPPQPGAA